jgi:hypothetical protein
MNSLGWPGNPQPTECAKIVTRITGAICLFIVACLLAAGLWPFNLFPRNNVSWLKDGNGLQFSENATIYSSGVFAPTQQTGVSFCSLEVWLEPSAGYLKNSATILAFYSPDNPLQFRLKQSADYLVIKRDYRDQQNDPKTVKIEIEHAFRRHDRALFTVTSSLKGTAVYFNGALVNVFPGFGLSCRDFSGQLLLGGSPITYSTWQGKLFGLAIYEQELTSEQVARHYAMWTRNAALDGAKNDRILALYSFAEGSGRTVRNSIGSQPEIYIPRIFDIPHKKLLASPWEEFSPNRGWVLDILINIAGFMPFGFFCYSYFRSNRKWNRAGIATILCGAIISITIELLQRFIPSRMSGITDIITNTVGTAFGVTLGLVAPFSFWLPKMRQPGKATVIETETHPTASNNGIWSPLT